MQLHLTNLDELIQNVRNIHAKNYLNESIAAYRAGAYRASLITTWIAVCVDIIEKIRELSLSNDTAAKKHNERLNSIQANDPAAMLAFERDILDIACDDLQLISQIEKSHLERLKEDRNICAHPTFSEDGSQFSPPAELALSYIVQVSNYLLIHQPVKGKAILQRLFKLINEPSFPKNEGKAYSLLSSENNLGRVRESVVQNLTIILIKRLFRDEKGISINLVENFSAAFKAIRRLYPKIFRQVFSTKLDGMLSEANEMLLKRIFPFLNLMNEVWGDIATAQRVRIEGLIGTMKAEEISHYHITQLAEINVEIRNYFFQRFETFDNAQKTRIIATNPLAYLKKYAIELFSISGSFDTAESRAVKLLLPMSKYFDDEDLALIFQGSLENKNSAGINQILNAGGIDDFFASLYTETKAAPLKHRKVWIKFWEDLGSTGFEIPPLQPLLAKDGYISSEKDTESDMVNDRPF